MCHPTPASPSRRSPIAPVLREYSSTMKMMSVIDGEAKRNHEDDALPSRLEERIAVIVNELSV